MKNSRLLTIGTVAALFIAGLTWFLTGGSKAEASIESAPPPMVVAAHAIAVNHAPVSNYTGALAAAESVALRPRVAGYLQSVSVPEGQLVRRGQALFQLDPKPFQAKLSAARAVRREAEAKLRLAMAENTRTVALLAEGVIAQERADRAAAAVAERQAQVAAAEAAERLASLDLSYTSVTAPISGRVGKILVTRGNLVGTGETAPPLTTLVSVDPLYVEFNLDEPSYLRALAHGRAAGTTSHLPVKVRLEDGSTREGRLNFIGNMVDRSTGTISARAVIRNPGGALSPGLFARVELQTSGPRPTVLISDLAVGVEQGQRFVLVVGNSNVVERRVVRLGASVQGLRVVEDGLDPGDLVILKGLAGPGMKVSPKVVPMRPVNRVAANAGGGAR